MEFIELAGYAPAVIHTKSGNKKYKLNIAFTNEKVLVSNSKDKHKPKYYKKFVCVIKNRICLWYYWKCGHNQNSRKNKGVRYKHLLVPAKIPLDKLTLNSLGLLEAEMTKFSKRYNNVIFTNSEPKIINTIIRFFKRFGLTEAGWSWHITFNFKLKNHESMNETAERESNAKRHWLKNANIAEDKKQQKFLHYTGNKKYANMRAGSLAFGSLIIGHSNIILYQLIFNLLKKIRKIVLKEEKFCQYYLQGITAGEGDVKLTKYKSIDSIRLGSTDANVKKFYSRCLKKLGINSQIEQNYVCINNQRNFFKIFGYDLFTLHPKRKEKFIGGIANFKQIPDSLKKEFKKMQKVIYNKGKSNIIHNDPKYQANNVV